MSKTTKWITIGLCALFANALVSCNTALGFGRDLQQGGQAIEKTVYGR